jgi:hypothetical protein
MGRGPAGRGRTSPRISCRTPSSVLYRHGIPASSHVHHVDHFRHWPGRRSLRRRPGPRRLERSRNSRVRKIFGGGGISRTASVWVGLSARRGLPVDDDGPRSDPSRSSKQVYAWACRTGGYRERVDERSHPDSEGLDRTTGTGSHRAPARSVRPPPARRRRRRNGRAVNAISEVSVPWTGTFLKSATELAGAIKPTGKPGTPIQNR